jgi:hypothetical protein
LDKINKTALACLERVNAFIDSDETMAGLIDLISGASYIIIISRFMPTASLRRYQGAGRFIPIGGKRKLKNKNLLTIVHCGFREVEHDIFLPQFSGYLLKKQI